MIFFAVAGPTPGRASRSDSDAVLRSTGPLGAAACADLALERAALPAPGDAGISVLADLALDLLPVGGDVAAAAGAAGAEPPPPKVTRPFSLATVAAGIFVRALRSSIE